MSDTQMTPDQIVEAMPNFLIPEKAGTTKATIAFDLSGDNAGKWWVKIHDGAAESGKGDPADPANLTLQADSNDWVKIMTGQMDGTSAFMQGKLKIKGDMGLAIKLQTLFRRPSFAPGDRGHLLPRLEVGRNPALEVGGAAPLVGRDDHERELARA